MNTATKSVFDKCEDLVKELNQRYPAAGLSFGYIGNVSHQYDDRSWRFFTKIKPIFDNKSQFHQSRNNWSFGSCATGDVPHLYAYAKRLLEAQIRTWLGIDGQIDPGKLVFESGFEAAMKGAAADPENKSWLSISHP